MNADQFRNAILLLNCIDADEFYDDHTPGCRGVYHWYEYPPRAVREKDSWPRCVHCGALHPSYENHLRLMDVGKGPAA